MFWRILVTKQLMGGFDFHSIFLEVNGYLQLFGYQYSSNYLILCSTEEWTHAGLEQLDG